MAHDPKPETWTPSSTLPGADSGSSPLGPQIVHNHFHAAGQTALPWYRRRKAPFWLAVVLLAVVIASASAVILGVILKLELGKKTAQRADADNESAGDPSQSSSLGMSQLSTSPTSPSVAAGSVSLSPHISTSIPTDSASQLNETVLVSSLLAIFTDNSSPGSSSSSSAPRSSSSTSTLTLASTSSLSATAQASETPAEVFTLSESSQIASIYFNDTSKLHRRLLVFQDSKAELVAIEWSNGRKLNYRIRDRAEAPLPDAKLGTPLAMTVSSRGAIHLFFLDTQDAVSHVFEETKGEWRVGMPSHNDGPIVASSSSPLSAVWHRGDLLGVAFSSSQKLRLALTDEPSGDGTWHIVEAADLPAPVPGLAESPLFSVAGDWGRPASMLMAVLVDDGLFVWTCPLDLWPPAKAKPYCHRLNDTFQDERGHDMGFTPPPRQLGWIRLEGGDWDFSLLSLDARGDLVEENRIKAGGKGRKTGRGVHAKMEARAIATTDEGLLFAAAGDDVYVYRLYTQDWTWHAQGSLLAVDGSTERSK